MKVKNLLINISGEDRPGITAQLTQIIAQFQTPVIDMGQSITHGLLSLSLLLRCGQEDQDIIKELLFMANSQNLQLNFSYPEQIQLTQEDKSERYALSCVGPEEISSQFIAQVAAYLAAHGINIVRIYSDQKHQAQLSHLEFLIAGAKDLNWSEIKNELLKISIPHQIDFCLVKDDIFRANKRLVVFDMDSTLTKGEVIDELAELAGVSEQVKAITQKAMEGELEFEQALRQRVALLKGLEEQQLQTVCQKLELTPGAADFIQVLQSLGCQTAVISGGFDFFTAWIAQNLNLDYHYGNQLEIIDGKLTGQLKGMIVDGAMKAKLMQELAIKESISLQQVAAIGDGANDLPMLSAAGMGIAFHAKQAVKRQIGLQLSFGPMNSLLWFLGIPTSYSAQYANCSTERKNVIK